LTTPGRRRDSTTSRGTACAFRRPRLDPADPQWRDLTFAGNEQEGWYRLIFLDPADNESPATLPVFDAVTVPQSSDMLISLETLKESIGTDPADTSRDNVLTAAIKAASQFAFTYTDRDFASEGVEEERTYRYDGSGFLEIDDAQEISTIEVDGRTLDADAYLVQPTTGVSTWLELDYIFRDPSGAMGFTYNLDRYIPRSYRRTVDVVVTGTWGWPDVPYDVQQAIIWIAASFAQNPESGGAALTSESIAEVARSWANEGMSDTTSLPRNALSILDQYKRWSL
jgi:hypothetical protein